MVEKPNKLFKGLETGLFFYFFFLLVHICSAQTPLKKATTTDQLQVSKCVGASGGKVGLCAPQFSLKDASGKIVSLSDFFGKVVVLNFWATWCKPCAVEIPSMTELYKNISGSSVVMLAVSIDKEGPPVVEKYFKNVFEGKVPPFKILFDSEAHISKLYGTYKVPETYIIDTSGKVRDKIEGIFDWNSSIVKNYVTLLSQTK